MNIKQPFEIYFEIKWSSEPVNYLIKLTILLSKGLTRLPK